MPSVHEKPPPPRVIIIGAGWTGLAAAKTYLQIRPDIDLLIIDEDKSIGGVWSNSRLYPGLIADSCVGIFDYSDLPMGAALGLEEWADLPAHRVYEYLERYVDMFGLREYCRLNTRVVSVHRNVGMGTAATGWKVKVESYRSSSSDRNEVQTVRSEVLLCDKLIIATGTSSTPRLPDDIDWTEFEGIVMHSKDVGEKHRDLTSASINRITVIGGNKSAVDVVNLCARAGKQVDWVIRENGWGPGFLFKARSEDGKHLGSLKAKRISAVASPNILSISGFWYFFLHSGKSWVGSRFLQWILSYMSRKAIKDLYSWNENTSKIAPDVNNLFWSQSGVSVVHDDEFMKMVAEGNLIHVHRKSVASLRGRSVHLSTGQSLPCDAIVFATGWQRNQPSLFDQADLCDLGFPEHISEQSAQAAKHWETLDASAREKVCKIFPMLASPPPDVAAYLVKHAHYPSTTPFRLFRHIVPPNLASDNDRSLIVLGLMINTSVPLYAEISSLWGVAYLENLPFAPDIQALLSNRTSMQENISSVNAWGELKNPHQAEHYPDGSNEIQDFTDLLLKDLGLRPDRKRLATEITGITGIFGVRAWWREWLDPYKASDYKGLVDEYMASISASLPPSA